MLIILEGIDGCGKSTQAAWLSERLRARGIDPLLLREPGGTALGEHLRALLLDARAAVQCAPLVADLMAPELGWSDAEKRAQIEAFVALADGYLLA